MLFGWHIFIHYHLSSINLQYILLFRKNMDISQYFVVNWRTHLSRLKELLRKKKSNINNFLTRRKKNQHNFQALCKKGFPCPFDISGHLLLREQKIAIIPTRWTYSEEWNILISLITVCRVYFYPASEAVSIDKECSFT